MATVLQEYNIEEQCSLLCVVWAKGLNAKGIHKESFRVYGGKRKAVHNWFQKFSQGHSNIADDETEAREWLGQQ
jgi:hypothetical protein